MNKKFTVLSVRGGTIENINTPEAKVVKENTFFVVDIKRNGHLKELLRALGEEFNQDSIMFIPQGGEESQIWGTRNDDLAEPKYGECWILSNLKFGYKNITDKDKKDIPGYTRPDPEYFTLKSGRPFFFESIMKEFNLPGTINGYRGINIFSNKPWNQIEENCFDRLEELKYFGSNNLPEASAENGYWAFGSKVFDVTSSSHINFIINNPDKFNLTEEEIQSIFDKYGEKLNLEGKAREELIKLVSKMGWMRIRHYSRPKDYWSIQVDSTKLRRTEIKNFIYWAIDHKLMYYHDPVIILGYDNPSDVQEYSYQSGGVKNFLMEGKLINYIGG
jgi:hypothetical protein